MRYLAAVSVIAIFTGQADAASQVRSSSMSCNALKAAVAESGAMTIPYQSSRAPELRLYDRFVRGTQFCAGDEVTEVKFVPAQDTPNCALSRCVPIDCGPGNDR
jgi:hypothetical protein